MNDDDDYGDDGDDDDLGIDDFYCATETRWFNWHQLTTCKMYVVDSAASPLAFN